jgi:hypothetical protein
MIEAALIEIQGALRIFGGARIVRDHDNGLAVIAVQQRTGP